MGKRKILFISNIASEKIGSFSLASINAAQNVGLEFHIVANFTAESNQQRIKDEKLYGIKIHHVDFVRNPFNYKNIKAFKQLIKLMKEEKFDMVHCNTPTGGVYGRLAAKMCKINNVIYQVHGFHFYKNSPKINWFLYYPVEKILARITDKIITINHEDFEVAKKFRLRNNGKVYYVPGVGIDTKLYKSLKINKLDLRKSLGFDSQDRIIISVGRLEKNKNNKTIINSLSILNDKKNHLIICGSGEEEYELKGLVKKLGMEKNIHFLGNRSDMGHLYRAADIFVMASYREGLSRAIMEAMASGLPCVVSKIRGNVDLIYDGKGGYLANPKDSTDFAEKIKLIYSNTWINEMREFNRHYIEKFNFEKVMKKIEKVYKDY